jgi:hypothetical protein
MDWFKPKHAANPFEREYQVVFRLITCHFFVCWVTVQRFAFCKESTCLSQMRLDVIQAVDSAGLWGLALCVMPGCGCGHRISKRYPITGLDSLLGLQEVEANALAKSRRGFETRRSCGLIAVFCISARKLSAKGSSRPRPLPFTIFYALILK